MFSPQSLATIVTLAAAVALGPLSTDMYLPALPRMTDDLHTSVDQMQLTLSVFFAGFAVAQLLYGPLADRFGRKPIMMAGLAIFSLASIGCAMATTVEQLTAFRFVQALGACGGPVLGRTMVRDIHGPEKAAPVLALIGTIMALAPAVAPVFGGGLIIWFDWQAIFLFLAFFGFVLMAVYGLNVQESLKEEYKKPFNLASVLNSYSRLLRHREYVGYTLTCSFVFSGLFCFLSASSFVLINFFGVAEEHFGFYFTMVVCGYVIGTQLVQRFSVYVGQRKMLFQGALIAMVAGIAMAVPSLLQKDTLGWLIGTQVLFMVGVGMVMPLSMGGALAPFSDIAGTASSLLGFLQSLVAATVGIIVGHMYSETPLVMTVAIAMMGTLTLVSYLLFLRQKDQPQA